MKFAKLDRVYAQVDPSIYYFANRPMLDFRNRLNLRPRFWTFSLKDYSDYLIMFL